MAKAKEEIRSLARKHTATAVRTLAGIMNSRKAQPSARVSAAQALLDRGWGRPEQPVDVTHNTSEAFLAALKAITEMSKTDGLGQALAGLGEEPPAVRH